MWKTTRVAAIQSRSTASRGLQSRRIVRVWDRVQPSFWHPMASLEQSLMDVEVMARRVFSPSFPPYAPLAPSRMPQLQHDDDEFFEDLPILAPNQASKTSATPSAESRSELKQKTTSESTEKEGTEAALAAKEPSAGKSGTATRPSYTCYSYSYSTCLDCDGHRVGTARRRYEDSTGRLKATHEREMDDKKLKMVWTRSDTKDEGNYETICSTGTPEEFEQQWFETPFGRAEDEEQAKWMEERERSVYQAFGIDYKPLEEAEKAQVATAPSLEQEVKQRKEAIQEAAKRQEEETTPPQYTS